MIVIDRFGGIAPRTDPAKLPDYGAQLAQNCKLHSGAIKGWRKPLSLAPAVPVADGTTTIFYDPGSTVWFRWGVDVDVALGPVSDASAARRYYYTGDTTPRKTDSAMAVAGSGTYPQTWYELGVPTPAAAPTLALGGSGSGTAVDRVYVYTQVSTFSGIEEESAPSPPATITWQPGNTVSVSAFSAYPTGGYNVTKRRIYRDIGSGYQFVAETTSAPYVDSIADSALGAALTTIGHGVPPTGLTGLVALANGIMAGFVNNEVWFTPPYKPHAWPAGYAQAVNETIVAIVPHGQGAYILTDGHPYFFAGTTPDGMTPERLGKYAPCLAKRSAATNGDGVLYASYNGVAYLQGSSVSIFGAGLFTQEEWAALGPENMHARYYDERYMLWHAVTEVVPLTLDGSWVLDGSENLDGIKGLGTSLGNGLIFDTTQSDAPLTKLIDHTLATYIRPDTGLLYLVHGGEVKQFDGDEINRYTYEWRSKIILLPKPQNYAVLQVLADHDGDDNTAADATEARRLAEANATLWAAGAYNAGWAVCGVNEFEWNGSAMHNLPQVDDTSLSVKFYADGILKASANLTDNRPIRLPAGYKADRIEVAVSGNKTVRRILIAQSMREARLA